MKALVLFTFLLSFIQLFAVTALAQQADWSVKKTGNVGLTFFIRGKDNQSTFTYQDKRDGISGVLWTFSKVNLQSYPNPVLVAIFGHGAKSYSLKILDPLKPEKDRVLFEQSSDSEMPTYELIGNNERFSYIDITYYENITSEITDDNLYGEMSNSQVLKTRWPPSDREVQSQPGKKKK